MRELAYPLATNAPEQTSPSARMEGRFRGGCGPSAVKQTVRPNTRLHLPGATMWNDRQGQIGTSTGLSLDRHTCACGYFAGPTNYGVINSMFDIYYYLIISLVLGYSGFVIVYIKRMFKEKENLPPASQDFLGPAKYWARNGDKWAILFILYHWTLIVLGIGFLFISFI